MGADSRICDYKQGLIDYYNQEIEIIKRLDVDSMAEVMAVFEEARAAGKRIYICGNGGSAATASHFCADFNKGVSLGLDKRYRFECLSDNVPMLMAVANDLSYDDVFSLPLEGKLCEGDVVVGISGSGNSANVVRALKYAKDKGNTTVAMVGYDGGKLKDLADYVLHVEIPNIQIVEDVHMTFDHSMMFVLSNLLK